MKTAAIAAVSAAFTVGLSTARADVWIVQDGKLERRDTQGVLVSTIAAPFGEPIAYVREAAVDPATGNIWIITQQLEDDGSRTARLLGVTATGNELWQQKQRALRSIVWGVAIDAARRGIWVSLLDIDDPNDRQAVLHDQVSGRILATVRLAGLTPVEAVGADGAVWIGADSSWIRLEGTTEELDGYEIVGRTGPNHQTFRPGPGEEAVAVDPVDGGLYFTNVFCDMSTSDTAVGTLLKFSAAGEELFRYLYEFECRGGAFSGLAIHPRDRSVVVTMAWFDGRVRRFSPRGAHEITASYSQHVDSVTVDAEDSGIWIGHMPDVDDDIALIAPMVLRKLNGFLQSVVDVPFPGVVHVIGAVPRPETLIALRVQPQRGSVIDLVQSNGQVRVALLSSARFDPLQVDVETIRFGTRRAVVRDFWTRHVNADAIADLIVVFDTKATGVGCGDIAAPLSARTHQGLAVLGTGRFTTRCSPP